MVKIEETIQSLHESMYESGLLEINNQPDINGNLWGFPRMVTRFTQSSLRKKNEVAHAPWRDRLHRQLTEAYLYDTAKPLSVTDTVTIFSANMSHPNTSTLHPVKIVPIIKGTNESQFRSTS